MFFPIGVLQFGEIHKSAVTATKLPSVLNYPVFSGVSFICRGTWIIELAANMGWRPPLFILKRHSRGALWCDLLQRSIAVSAAFAPVVTN